MPDAIRRHVRGVAPASADASPSRRQDLCQTPLLRWSSELDFHRPLPETLLPTPLTSAGHGEQPACHYGHSDAPADASLGAAGEPKLTHRMLGPRPYATSPVYTAT